MTNMLERLHSEDDTGRIEKLEAELQHVRDAFEEYIATTEGLEGDVNAELNEMQNKLNQSNAANSDLMKRFKETERLFKDVERSSEETKDRLRKEAKLRRQAERALMDAKIEMKTRGSFLSTNLERSDSLRIADSGVMTEMMSNTANRSTERELEKLTKELISTQRKLRKTEEQLEESKTLVKDLERDLENMNGDEASKHISGDDSALLRELDEIRAEIDAARSEIQSHSSVSEVSREKVAKYESQLKESLEENERLVEEITCLRNILYDQDLTAGLDDNTDGAKPMSTKEKLLEESKKLHQQQISTLREQYEATLNQNMDLHDQVKKLQRVNSSTSDNQVSLKNEVDRLNDELEKLQREMAERRDSEDVTLLGVKFANDNSTVGDHIMDEKLRQTEEMLKQSQEECSEMRSEILVLTESLYNAQRGRSADEILRRAQGGSSAPGDLSRAQNEIEKKKNEIMTLKNNLMSRQEEVRLLSEEISYMTSAFEKAQDEYNSVVEELEKVQEMYEQSRNDPGYSEAQSQFKTLSEKNEALARQVREMESIVEAAYEKQEKVKASVVITEELKAEIDRVVDEADHKNQAVDELTLMVEDRLNQAEKCVDKLEKDIALIGSGAEIGESIFENEHGAQSHEWLASQYRNERDEKVKAAISATMTYLNAASAPKSEDEISHTSTLKDEDDKLLDDILSVKTVEETKAIEEISVEKKTFESAFQGNPRLLDIKKSIDKLTEMSRRNEDDRTIDTAVSQSSNSYQSRKASTKYEDIMKKVAKYGFASQITEDKNEVEIRAEIGSEQRE